MSITVHNQNFGLVREVRTIELPQGRVSLEFRDVQAMLVTPTTVVEMTIRWRRAADAPRGPARKDA